MGIFSALVGAVSGIGTWFAGLGAAAQAFVQIGAGLAFNAISAALAGRPEAPKEPGIVGELQQGADIPRSFIMGRRATAGSLVYHNEWGDDNELYTRITALSDLPITDLVHIWIDGKRYELDKANPHPDYGWPIVGLSETRTETRSVVIGYNDDYETDIYGTEEVEISETIGWVLFHNGTQATASAFVVNDVATEERPWSSSDIGVGVAHAVTTFKIDREVFQGLPELLFVCDGIAIENPATQANEFTENPLIMAHQVIEGISYGGQWFYGPEQAGRFDLSELTAEIAKCDVPVPGADQMTSEQRIEAFGADIIPARYRASLEVSLDRPPADILEDLLSSCNGRASEVGTRYRLQVGDPAAAVANITDDDILSTEGQSFAPFFPLAETVNAITATYPAPSDGWQQQDAPPLYRPDLEGEDGNRRLPSGVSLPAVPFPEQVQRLMASALAEARRARRHSLVLPAKFWRLEPGDFIDFTSDRNGYADKVFRVDGVSDLPNGDLAIDITEVDPSDYDWTADSDFTSVTGGALSGLSLSLPVVQGWDFRPSVAPGDSDGSDAPALVAIWNRPADNSVDRLEIQARRLGGLELVVERSVTNVALGIAPITDGIVRDTSYQGRARYIVRGRAGPWTAWVTAQSPDVRVTAADIVDELTEKLTVAFDRHDQALETVTSGAVFDLLKETRITDAILAAQTVSEGARQVVAFEENADTAAAVVFEAQARADGDAAQASLTATLTGRVAANEAWVSNVGSLKVDAAGAVAAVETEIVASYGDLSAMASATSFAEAQANGINAGFVWRLNGSNIMEMVSVQDGTSGPTQTFRLGADYVQITGLTQIDSAVVALLAADSAFIGNLVVDTLQIAGNAVTIPVSGTSSNNFGNGNWQTMVTIAINLPVQSDVLLLWSIEQGYSGTIPTWGYQLRNNLTGLVYDEREGMTFGNDQPSGQWLLLDQAAGTFRVQLRWKGQNSNISGVGALTVLVVKR